MAKWHCTKYPGVRYREHATRKHGVQYDKYFAVRYTYNGKRCEEALGWASDGWTPQSAAEELARLKRAQRTGEGAYTMAERREQEEARRKAEENRKAQEQLDSLTLEQFWNDTYFPHAQSYKAKQTYKTESSYYSLWIKPVLGEKPFKKISPFDLEKIKRNMLKAEKSPKTMKHVMGIIRQIINHASFLGLFQGENPVIKVKIPHSDNKRIRFLSHNEANILLDKLLKTGQDLYDMALLALHCGPRAGEIFGLTWRDIDFDQRLVTFRDTKNKHVRHIPMTEEVKKTLNSRKTSSDSELVFPARNGGKRKEVSNSFERAIVDLKWNEGIDDSRQKVVFHTLRHTCASWLVMAGVPLYTVKEYLGHKQISQTERYAHLAPDSLKQATEALNKISSNKPEDLPGGVQVKCNPISL